MSRIETFVSGQWAVDLDMDSPLMVFAQAMLTPDRLREVFNPQQAAALVMDYALVNDCTLDQAIEAVNAREDDSPAWATVRWATEEEKARVA